MGDMGAHTMDLCGNVVDAGAPSAIEIDLGVSDQSIPHLPRETEASFEQPATIGGTRHVVWLSGGLKPRLHGVT
jgi:hypothetical protein